MPRQRLSGRALFWLLALPLLALLAGVGVLLITASKLAVLFALMLSAAVVIIIWALLDRLCLQPLAAMVSAARIIEIAHPEHRPELPQSHLLGELPQALQGLGAALRRARHSAGEQDVVLQHPSQQRRWLLEDLIQSLDEGVLVCTSDGSLMLYNDAACRLFANNEELGLGRSVCALLDGAATEAAFQQARRRIDDEGVEYARFRAMGLCCCLTALVDRPGRQALYLLSCYAEPASGDAPTTPVVSAGRPEFYDLALALADQAKPAPAQLCRPLRKLRFVVFDCETTGLRPGGGDRMVQLAGVRVNGDRVLDSEVFDQLIDPRRPIPAAASRIHGIDDAQVSGQPEAAAVVRRFRRFIGDDGVILVAHNADFDLAFLGQALPGVEGRFDNPVLDTLLLSVFLHGHADGHGLDAVAERLGVAVAKRHCALSDSLCTAAVLVKLIALLETRGVRTLGDALTASERMAVLRRRLAPS